MRIEVFSLQLPSMKIDSHFWPYSKSFKYALSYSDSLDYALQHIQTHLNIHIHLYISLHSISFWSIWKCIQPNTEPYPNATEYVLRCLKSLATSVLHVYTHSSNPVHVYTSSDFLFWYWRCLFLALYCIHSSMCIFLCTHWKLHAFVFSYSLFVYHFFLCRTYYD